MDNNPIVIVSYSRTPQGNFLGVLKDVSATELGKTTIAATLGRVHLTKNSIQEVIMGCVLSAGLGQAPARQAALKAGLDPATSCTTINKMCGSGMKAVMLGCNSLDSHPGNIVIAGGMESMSNAPFLLLKAREGYRLGTDYLYDHMTLDGLEDAYEKGKPMGFFAEQCAKQSGLNRELQDQYALTSFERARSAIQNNFFTDEIAPVKYFNKKNKEIIIDQDEHPFSVPIEKMAELKPVFDAEGTITAASSAAIADGAASILLMRQETAKRLHLKPLARIVDFSTHSDFPNQFPKAPISAIQKLLSHISWQISDVDLFEVNEAFAAVPLVTMQELSIPHEKMNIWGSGCALGHPIGATGARILVTLISALRRNKLKKGIASLCIGGGEATAIAIEVI